MHVVVAPTVQFQPLPLAAVAVNPAGSVSLTVTVPELASVPGLLTVSVKGKPACPWNALPVCVFVMVRSIGLGLTVTLSLAVSFAVLVSPPPDTVAVLVMLVGALTATFTVNVIAG